MGNTTNYLWDYGIKGEDPWFTKWESLWQNVDQELYKRSEDLFMQGHDLYGSDQAGGDLFLKSTSHATKGKIYFGANSVYDEVNGRLGIGTVSPSYLLDVNGGFRLGQAGGGLIYNVEFTRSGGSVGYPDMFGRDGGAGLVIAGQHDGVGSIQFVTKGLVNPSMSIADGGNVGIDTVAPTSKLHILGDLNVANGPELVSNGGMETGNPPTGWVSSSTPETFEQSTTQKHAGTYSAHIVDSTPSYGGFKQLLNGGTSLGSKRYKLSFWYWIVSGGVYAGVVNDAGWDSLNAITTTGSWQYAEYIFTDNGSTNPYAQFQNISGSVAGEFYIDDVSVTEMGDAYVSGNLNVTGQGLFTGNVGIGTVSPGQELEVNGDIIAGRSISMGKGALANDWVAFSVNRDAWSGAIYNSAKSAFAFVTPGNSDILELQVWSGAGASVILDAWVVDAAGNVGIGTVSPTSKLHVLGGLNVANGPELVTNGGMETGNPPTGWNACLTPETFEQSNVQKHGGSYSAHVVDSTPSYGGFITGTPAYSFSAGKRYKLSFWYWLVSGTLDVLLRDGDGIGLLTNAIISSPTEAWTYHEEILTSLISGTSAVIWFINHSNSVAAEFYIDDVSVVQTGDAYIGGNLGIGTVSPARQLEICGGGNPQLRLTNAGYNYWDIWAVYANSNIDLQFLMAGSEKLRINAYGQVCIGYSGSDATGSYSLITASSVGIGTPTPDTRLDIEDGALSMLAMSAPGTPATDKVAVYITASGTTPNRVVSLCCKGPDGVEHALQTWTV